MKVFMIARAAVQPLTVLAITILNRGAGYMRDVLMTAALGTSSASQVFVYAFRVFGIVRALTSEGAIPAVVVDRMIKAGKGRQWNHARSFAVSEWGEWWIFLLSFSLLIAFANPFLMQFLIPPPIYASLENDIIPFSALLGIGLALNTVGAFYPSIFQAQGRFIFHSLLYSIINIGFILLFVLLWALDINKSVTVSMLISVAFIGTGVVQIVVASVLLKMPLGHLVWPLKTLVGVRVASTRFLSTLRAMTPIAMFNATSPLAAVLATAVLVRGGLNITQFFVAERLVQLLPGTVGYAIGVVVLPMIARQYKNGSPSQGNDFAILIGSLSFFGILASTALLFFSEQAIEVLYQRFNFSSTDALRTADYLEAISISALPLLLEQALANRLFAFMNFRANRILFAGSAIACTSAWLSSEILADLAGIDAATEACAVFTFIVFCRVLLLLALNIGITRPRGDCAV